MGASGCFSKHIAHFVVALAKYQKVFTFTHLSIFLVSPHVKHASPSYSPQVAGPDGADLQVDFLKGYHGDGYPFDGPGGAVGHAFFPSDPSRAGGVHLDAEEEWSFRKPGGFSLKLAIHSLV